MINLGFNMRTRLVMVTIGCFILILIGPVDISKTHLVEPNAIQIIITIILLVLIWLAPSSPMGRTLHVRSNR